MDAAQRLGARSGLNAVEVWAGNAEGELQLLRGLVREFPIVTLLSQPTSPRRVPPATLDGFYQDIRTDVDTLRVVYLGLANKYTMSEGFTKNL